MHLHIAWSAIGVVGLIVLIFAGHVVYVVSKSGGQLQDDGASTPLKDDSVDPVDPSEPLYPIDCQWANRYHYMSVSAAILSLVATVLSTIEAWKKADVSIVFICMFAWAFGAPLWFWYEYFFIYRMK